MVDDVPVSYEGDTVEEVVSECKKQLQDLLDTVPDNRKPLGHEVIEI